MKHDIAVEELENAKRKILRENLKPDVLDKLESIEKAINILKGRDTSSSRGEMPSMPPASSLQGLVVNAVVELIHKTGRQVRNEEILAYLDEKQITLGKAKNKNGALASILYQENKRTDGKIKQVSRGVYYIK
jgi:hypothetical protein